MKTFARLFLLIMIIAALNSCKKEKDLPFYGNGSAPLLSASAATIAPTPADSLSDALTLTWTNPEYAIDSSNLKFVVQIDSASGDFEDPWSRVITGALSTTFTAKELNDILLSYGFAFGVPYDVKIRVLSSYANNNEQLASNTLTIQMTPYKVPPKVLPPSSGRLYLVGDATAGGWNNPVPAAAQELTMIDSLTYVDTVFMNGGKQYLLLPVNGDWTHKYAVADNSLPGLSNGGDFGYDFNDNFPGPATTGMYSIFVDFQQGTFTLTKIQEYGLLYVPGDYQGWDPATAPTLGSEKNDGVYQGYINIPAGGSNEFKLTPGPAWDNAIGDGGGGTLVPGGGGNLNVPGAGFYLITANTNDNTWSATKTTWSMIGSFAASGWSTDIPMTYNAGDRRWEGQITTADGDQFKFRANNDWGLNYGDNGEGKLEKDGSNIGDKSGPIPAGTHTIYLYLNSSGYYTYSIL
jgi:hypothetical protein